MSHQILKKNIEILLKKNNYRPSELEGAAGLKHGNVTNILNGKSKKPSAEILLSIAKIFSTTVEDLLSESDIDINKILNDNDLNLILNTIRIIIETVKNNKVQVTRNDIVSIMNESLNYSLSSGLQEPDKRFIQWIIKQKYHNHSLI